MKFGSLKTLELRKVWAHESKDFSTWLSKNENLNLLGNEIGMPLEIIKREALAGKFRVDILAQNTNNNEIVIIENQLENTNHSHLGQLITYSSHYDAKSIIWIVKELRIEHEKAIEWLNRNLSNEIKLFLVKIELLSIDNSLPAPRFSLISKPFGWTNTLFRESSLIENSPKELFEFEVLRKSIVKPSLIDFLNKFVTIEWKYSKKELFEYYMKSHKKDCDYYVSNKHQFRKDLNAWAELNSLIINKHFQNPIQKGNHKSGGIEYITFNRKD